MSDFYLRISFILMFNLIHQGNFSECQEDKMNLGYIKSRIGRIYNKLGMSLES